MTEIIASGFGLFPIRPVMGINISVTAVLKYDAHNVMKI
jgi:hypothetical protein